MREVLFEVDTGTILLTRSIAAPRDDLVPAEGQGKLFVDFDPGDRPVSAFRVNPEQRTIELRADFVEPEMDAELALSSDATATSPIDAIPEIPADGNSLTTITVQKKSVASGRPVTGAGHRNRLSIRTTAGTLSARQLNLERGQASFRLRSSTETVVAEVRVWAEGIPRPATIRIEFAPVP
jgi:hypothetical protein